DLNENSSFHIGKWLNFMIKYWAPAILLGLIVWNILVDIGLIGVNAGEFPTYFGADMELGGVRSLVWVAPLMWIVLTAGLGGFFTWARARGSNDDDDDQGIAGQTEAMEGVS